MHPMHRSRPTYCPQHPAPAPRRSERTYSCQHQTHSSSRSCCTTLTRPTPTSHWDASHPTHISRWHHSLGERWIPLQKLMCGFPGKFPDQWMAWYFKDTPFFCQRKADRTFFTRKPLGFFAHQCIFVHLLIKLAVALSLEL